MSAEVFISEVKKLIEKIEKTQMDAIHQVAGLISDAIIQDNLVYIFGAGHSNILAIECFDRAGGLVNMQPIFDSGLDYFSGAHRQGGFERLPGYVKCIVGDYADKIGRCCDHPFQFRTKPCACPNGFGSKEVGSGRCCIDFPGTFKCSVFQ